MSVEENKLEKISSESSLVNQYISSYKVIQRINSGVYIGLKEDSQQTVAIKIFSPDPYACNREEILQRIKIIQELDHENIVKIYEAGETDQFIYAIMEYVPGENLYDLMQRNPRLHWAAAAELARDIICGLVAAHSKGIAHRCLHPDRILLSKNGQIKINFCNEGELSPSKEIANFVPPELFLGQDIDQKSDIYSLGSIICTIVTGKPPLAGKTPKEIATKHREMGTVLPNYGVADVPHSLSLILERSMEKDLKQRYQNSYELQAAIKNFLLNDIPANYRLGSYKDLFKVVEDTIGIKVPKKKMEQDSIAKLPVQSPQSQIQETKTPESETSITICFQQEWRKFCATVFPLSPFYLKIFVVGIASFILNIIALVIIKSL